MHLRFNKTRYEHLNYRVLRMGYNNELNIFQLICNFDLFSIVVFSFQIPNHCSEVTNQKSTKFLLRLIKLLIKL